VAQDAYDGYRPEEQSFSGHLPVDVLQRGGQLGKNLLGVPRVPLERDDPAYLGRLTSLLHRLVVLSVRRAVKVDGHLLAEEVVELWYVLPREVPDCDDVYPLQCLRRLLADPVELLNRHRLHEARQLRRPDDGQPVWLLEV